MSTANQAALRYVAESTIGTTPSNPPFQNLRYTSESINYNIENVVSNEIRSDRATTDLIQVNADLAGDINFEFSLDSFDDLIEAAFAGTWAVSGSPEVQRILKTGTSRKFFTIQKHFQDIGQYFNFTGCMINSFALNIAVGEIINGTFGVMGLSATRSESAISGQSNAAVNTNPVLNPVSNAGSILIDDTPYSGCITAANFTLNNNIRPNDCIGELGHNNLLLGRTEITGGLEIYFSEGSLYDNFLNGTDFSLQIPLSSGSDTYDILFPKVKFETAEIVAGGTDTDVMISTTFRALYDSVEDCMAKITYLDY